MITRIRTIADIVKHWKQILPAVQAIPTEPHKFDMRPEQVFTMFIRIFDRIPESDRICGFSSNDGVTNGFGLVVITETLEGLRESWIVYAWANVAGKSQELFRDAIKFLRERGQTQVYARSTSMSKIVKRMFTSVWGFRVHATEYIKCL